MVAGAAGRGSRCVTIGQQAAACLRTAERGATTRQISDRREARSEIWCRSLFFAWGYFCVSLVPVLGFVDVYFMKFSLVGDHYEYLALLGVAGFAGWAWAARRGAGRGLKLTGAILAISTLGVLTWRQCRMYRDAETLFSATIKRNPQCWMAFNNRGIIRAGSGFASMTRSGISRPPPGLEARLCRRPRRSGQCLRRAAPPSGGNR